MILPHINEIEQVARRVDFQIPVRLFVRVSVCANDKFSKNLNIVNKPGTGVHWYLEEIGTVDGRKRTNAIPKKCRYSK